MHVFTYFLCESPMNCVALLPSVYKKVTARLPHPSCMPFSYNTSSICQLNTLNY